MSQLADDLRAAKALIDTPEKWGKGGFRLNGRYCAIGAVGHVAGLYDGTYDGARQTRMERFLYRDSQVGGGVMAYNDAPTTTHADIMALFDRAIAAAEAAE